VLTCVWYVTSEEFIIRDFFSFCLLHRYELTSVEYRDSKDNWYTSCNRKIIDERMDTLKTPTLCIFRIHEHDRQMSFVFARWGIGIGLHCQTFTNAREARDNDYSIVEFRTHIRWKKLHRLSDVTSIIHHSLHHRRNFDPPWERLVTKEAHIDSFEAFVRRILHEMLPFE